MEKIASRLALGDVPFHDEISQEITYYAMRALPILKKRLFAGNVNTARNLPMSHVAILILLDRFEEMPISAISRSFGIARPNITPIINRLIEPGYIARRKDTRDRRVINVAILPRGKEKVAAILKDQSKLIVQSVGHLETMKQEALLNAVRTICDIFS